jgi:type IV pilus assembly protein PilM
MGERLIGLDVGTTAVRVAEVDLGPRPVLRTVGQVSLPPAATRDGEVVDPDVVAEAIRQLWRETGLTHKTVRVGVGSPRVVVRVVELPAMPDADLEGALRFQAQDYVPLPIDEVVLDFHVLETFTGPEDSPMARVLLAAGHRESVGNLLAAVTAAGLRVSGVDLLPLALIRGIGSGTGPPGSAEAIVSVGAAVTTVVVHEAGLPRLVRIVAGGGAALTEAVSRDLGVSPEAAEAVKRGAHPDEELRARAGTVVEHHVATVVGSIQGSLEYYLSQTEAAPVERMLLTGGGSLTPGVAEGLAHTLGLPVERGRLPDGLDAGDASLKRLESPEAELAVAVGLALGGGRAAVSPIDLLPEEARRATERRRALHRLAAAAAVLLFLLTAVSVFRLVGLAGLRDRVADQERTNQSIQNQIEDLAGPGHLQAELEAARQQLGTALAADVSWSRVLEDLGSTIPEGTWLTAFNAQLVTPGGTASATAPAPVAGAASSPGSGGTVSFTGMGLEFASLAQWLDRIPRIPYFLDLYLSTATRADVGSRPVVNFTSGASLGPAARSDRFQRMTAGVL